MSKTSRESKRREMESKRREVEVVAHEVSGERERHRVNRRLVELLRRGIDPDLLEEEEDDLLGVC